MKRLFILLTLCAIAGANASSGAMLGDYYQYLKQLQQLPETPERNAEIKQVIQNIAVTKEDSRGYGETRASIDRARAVLREARKNISYETLENDLDRAIRAIKNPSSNNLPQPSLPELDYSASATSASTADE